MSEVKFNERQCASLLEAYHRHVAPLLAEYQRQCDLLAAGTCVGRRAWDLYLRQCAALQVAHHRQCAPLWAEYQRCSVIVRQCAALLERLQDTHAEHLPRGSPGLRRVNEDRPHCRETAPSSGPGPRDSREFRPPETTGL